MFTNTIIIIINCQAKTTKTHSVSFQKLLEKIVKCTKKIKKNRKNEKIKK